MRSVPASFRSATYAQETGAVLPTLLEITHDSPLAASPMRIVDNTESIVFGGNTYEAVRSFEFEPPSQKDDGTRSVGRLTISAIDQIIPAIVRSASRATVRAVAVIIPESGAIEQTASWEFVMRQVSGDGLVVSCDLVYEERLELDFPQDEFNPNNFPGAF